MIRATIWRHDYLLQNCWCICADRLCSTWNTLIRGIRVTKFWLGSWGNLKENLVMSSNSKSIGIILFLNNGKSIDPIDQELIHQASRRLNETVPAHIISKMINIVFFTVRNQLKAFMHWTNYQDFSIFMYDPSCIDTCVAMGYYLVWTTSLSCNSNMYAFNLFTHIIVMHLAYLLIVSESSMQLTA